MVEYPIMFTDLRADTQVAVLEHMGVKHQKDMNWDVIPICVLPRPEVEKEMPTDDDRRSEGYRWCMLHGWFYAICKKCIEQDRTIYLNAKGNEEEKEADNG